MIYSYPYYATTYFGLGLGDDPIVNPSLDANGTGSIYFADEDYSSGVEESDTYQNGVLTSSFLILNVTDVFNVKYDASGGLTAYDTYRLGDSIHSGWELLDGSKGYDRLDYVVGTSPFGAVNRLEYTSTDGQNSYLYDMSNLGQNFHLEQTFNNPLTRQRSFEVDYVYSNLDGVIQPQRTVSEDGLTVTTVQSNAVIRQVTYDENRSFQREVRYDLTGVDLEIRKLANGDRVTTDFTGDHVASEVIRHADGSQSETSFSDLGLTTKTVERGVDGSLDVFLFRDGVLTDHNTYTAGSKLAVTDNIGADGSHRLIAHQTGQTLEGGATDDTLFDFGTTTFAFNPGFGRDTIRGFDASGSGHDVLALNPAFDTSQFVVSQVGADTHIQVTPQDEIILVGVVATSLPQFDILLV